MPEGDVRNTAQEQVIVFDTTLRDGEQSPGAATLGPKAGSADAHWTGAGHRRHGQVRLRRPATEAVQAIASG